jgi:ribosomal-protein-alanine N-acetyltransferase
MPLLTKPDIRMMTAADLDQVLAIEQASFPVPWKIEHFLHEITSPYSYPFVAECCGIVAGYVCLTALFEESQILDIAVAPSRRGNGIALALMEYAVELVREKGAEVLELEVRATNTAAIHLYERLGFIRSGCRMNYYEGIDHAVLMECRLK